MTSPRQRFLDYVRRVPGARPVVSPFLPHAGVVTGALRRLGLPVDGDAIDREIRLSRALDYEPMFMCGCTELIFPWQVDEERTDEDWEVAVLPVAGEEWVRRVARSKGLYGDESGFPVRDAEDHRRLAAVCRSAGERMATMRAYFRAFRQRIGDDGVVVIAHPHVTWLAGQISQPNMIYHQLDLPELFTASMDAILEASYVVFAAAMAEGIDFMSESSYGLEMVSPAQFAAQDVPYTRLLADWTHARGGLFWYHNCGRTRPLIAAGHFDRLGADVIETIAPWPEGDNDLRESRLCLAPGICSKGNLSLALLRDGSIDQVITATRSMVRAVDGFAHIHSTADAVFDDTPADNFIAFVRTAREEAERT